MEIKSHLYEMKEAGIGQNHCEKGVYERVIKSSSNCP